MHKSCSQYEIIIAVEHEERVPERAAGRLELLFGRRAQPIIQEP